MNFTGAASGRAAVAKQEAEWERKSTAKEDKPCSGCGHLCSAHAPELHPDVLQHRRLCVQRLFSE
jgi:hypothetical protein